MWLLLVFCAPHAWGYNQFQTAGLPEQADSMKWFLYYPGGAVAGSTATTAREDFQTYDTTFSLLDDSAYLAVLKIWWLDTDTSGWDTGIFYSSPSGFWFALCSLRSPLFYLSRRWRTECG